MFSCFVISSDRAGLSFLSTVFEYSSGNISAMKYMLFKQLKSEKESGMNRDTNPIMAKDAQNVIIQSKYFQKSAVKKSKRFRSAFTTEQLTYLETEFRKFPYIGSANRKEVASKLKIPERAVKIWFQNRRMKEKKEVANKEFCIEDLSKDVNAFTNEPLNNVRDWQSNNGRCCLVESAKDNQINFTNKLIAQSTSNVTKSNANPYPCNKSTLKHKEDVEVQAKAFEKPASKKMMNADANSKSFQAVKPLLKTISPEMSKQTRISVAPFNKQSNAPTSYCHLTKCYSRSNTDQEMPEDLSSSNVLNKSYLQQPYHYQVNSIAGTGFIPLQTQSTCPPSSLQHGNVIWKPINMVSALPGLSASVPMAVAHNSGGVPLVNQNIKNCSCNCNCHATLQRGFNQIDVRAAPQYILAIPFSNPSK